LIRFKTTRTALGLYGTLLVLPTLIFGWLYWRELLKAHEVEMASVPEDAEDGARKIWTSLKARMDDLIEAETNRPFTEYGEYVLPSLEPIGDEIRPQRSAMTERTLPAGILAYFRFDRSNPASPVDVFVGDDTFGRKGVAENFVPIIEEFRNKRDSVTVLTNIEPQRPPQAFPLAAVALSLGNGDLECIKKCSAYLIDESITVRVYDFRLQFYVDQDGFGRAVVSRRVRAEIGPLIDAPAEAGCLAPLMKGFDLQQGFLLDVNWLFKELPFTIAEHVLDAKESLVRRDGAGTIDKLESRFATFYPVEKLGFETFKSSDLRFGQLDVEIDTSEITARFDHQQRNLFAVGLMLVLTLATGMSLLYRSVSRELEQAHRTQNFVAAVTHELRTPVSTIRLHGEMLLDGWAVDEEKRQEYYRRIVRETGRLSTLVENVLEKSRLKESVTEPELSDLNEVVRRLEKDLASGDGSEDLSFDLAPRLPQVWLTPEGVRGVLLNLVENARKYAPVDRNASEPEPILVRTRWDGERALLEVLDRGPGVPAPEKGRIFDAFYRVGSEATRTTTGTGLGLHLVKLHADVAGARVSVHDREGGGSIFRLAYRASV